ncbi:MAG: MoxR family ATPase [Pseudoprimorskyibacter sp.]|nr:MoxR family ATPase [Pseudoprimorskyibacter sp.]
MTLEILRRRASDLRTEIARTVLGQDDVVEMLLIALFARGHVLIEGPPGTAKTLLARSFAASMDLDFGRIQFTPDLMPGDVLGTSIFDFSTSQFTLTKGPVFSQVLLADEINRAPPKTQAALLQAMNERAVTIDGTDYDLGREFIVVATQNPIEQQGTYPLPEAQLDRFLFKLEIDFPAEDTELQILLDHAEKPLEAGLETTELNQVLNAEDLAICRDAIDTVIIKKDILSYLLHLVRATRTHAEIAHGASTRAADALATAVRAAAAMDGRDYAIPDDVKRLFVPAMRHRIVLGPTAEIEGRNPDVVLTSLLNQIGAPR